MKSINGKENPVAPNMPLSATNVANKQMGESPEQNNY